MHRTPPPRELRDVARRPGLRRGRAIGVAVVLFAAALAAVPQAASAQTEHGQQQEQQEAVKALQEAIDHHRNNTGNVRAAERFERFLALVQDPAGEASSEYSEFCPRARANGWGTGTKVCDAVDAVFTARENGDVPPPVIEQQQQQEQQDLVPEIAVQNQDNNQYGIRFTQNGSEITTLNVGAWPAVTAYGVSLTTRPTSNVTVLFLTDNFLTAGSDGAGRNVLIDVNGNYQGTARPNVGRYIPGIHRERCNQSGLGYTNAVGDVAAHNAQNPPHLHLTPPDIANFTWVCETIMTFTPDNWNVPQPMILLPVPPNRRVMTSSCTGHVDGRFPERCNRDQIEHAAWSYDGSYPADLTTLNLHLAG